MPSLILKRKTGCESLSFHRLFFFLVLTL
jgi:hypothetical protein